ncbi:MAG: 2-oxo acid dehydrogenase subunit E2 [Actinomycetota bacterium]|nr:2-oxo acid dehydrogenase subunit E2 [Actinomycetota bacterium]
MANEVKLPRLGQGMESGTIVKWLKSEGDRVEKGEPLYELDTDKVTQEVEAEASGVLLKIAVQEGEVPVGETIAVIGEEGEEAPDLSGSGNGSAAKEVEEDPKEEGSPGPAREEEREQGREASSGAREQIAEARQPEPARDGGRVKASPLARRIARERGIDLASLSGTGPEGRIVAEDVERAEAGAAAAIAPEMTYRSDQAAKPEVEQLSSVRRTIARRLTEAWQAPAFQISMSADMTRAKELHARLAELAGEGPRPTITDILTKASAAALIRHRAVNVRFMGETIERYPSADIGLAVAIPDGLVVPVIRGSERRTIAEIAAARVDLVERARGGRLKREDLDGGTFTISNLGMYGVEQFVAVLNPPQAAILAVGAVEDRPVAREGELVVRPMMTMTLTCDHRALDGATASDFLRTVKSFLEEPGLML